MENNNDHLELKNVFEGESQSVPEEPIVKIEEPIKKGSSKLLKFVLILVLVMGLIGGGYFLYNSFLKDFINETIKSASINKKAVSLEKVNEYLQEKLGTLTNDEEGTGFESYVKNNNLYINMKMSFEEEAKLYEFINKDGILSVTIENQDFTGIILTTFVIIGISDQHGLDEKEVARTINDDAVKTYTIEDGLVITEVEDKITMQISLLDPLKLVDFSKTYVTVEKLLSQEPFISKKGSINGNIGDMSYYKENQLSTDYIEITIKEPAKISEKTYKSILSFIEVIEGEEELQNFTANYPSIQTKAFDKYEIILGEESNDGYYETKLIIKEVQE